MLYPEHRLDLPGLSGRKNRYAAYAKIDEALLERMAGLFARGVTASEASRSLGRNRNTINRYYRLFREALTRDANPERRIVPAGQAIVGLYLGAAHVQAMLVPDDHVRAAASALRGQSQASLACTLPDWPGYDALGDPATGAFSIMPCCLVGPVGQSRLAAHWRAMRERLCLCRGIVREDYWRHVVVCELIGMLGPEALAKKILLQLRLDDAHPVAGS